MSEDGPSPWIIRWKFKYPATPDMTLVCFAERGAADKYSVQMAGTAVVLQLISMFFCCGRCLVEFDTEPERLTLATQISGACD